MFRVSKQPYRSPQQDRIICKWRHHPPGGEKWNWIYEIWNNGQILMFKVSKCPYGSAQQDRIICKWHHHPPGGENGTKSTKSEIMDGFWCSRCQNDHIDLPNKIGSFASGTTTRLVVKNGTKKLFCLNQLVKKTRCFPGDLTSLHTKFEPNQSMHACATTFLVHAHYKKEHSNQKV